MIHIHLMDVKIFAYHGILPEEKILGTHFTINVDVAFAEVVERIDAIQQTIDYTELFTIVNNRMQQPAPLLETVVMDVGATIKSRYPDVHSINISLYKLNAPVTTLEGTVGVTWQQSF